MTKRRKLLILLAVCPVALYFAGFLLAPICGDVTGYADHQPSRRVVQPTNASPPAEVEKIQRLVKLHLDERPKLKELYWPEPSAIEEKPACWLVTFTAKTPIYTFCGVRRAFRPVAPVMQMSVDKADYGTRFGSWCQ